MNKATDRPRCVEQVNVRGTFAQYNRCARFGKVALGGRWYCAQHDPSEVAVRRAAKQAKWDAEWKGRKEALDKQGRINKAHPLAVKLAEAVRKAGFGRIEGGAVQDHCMPSDADWGRIYRLARELLAAGKGSEEDSDER